MSELSAQPQWFHFFRDIVRTGLLARMDGSTLKVYVAIKTHANHQSGLSGPTQPTISMETGLSLRTVQRSILELQKIGLLQKNKTQRKNNLYSLREKIQVMQGENPHSEIDFAYVPAQISSITKKIRDSINAGELPDSSNINITINMINGIQINGCDKIDEDQVAKIWDEHGGAK